MTLLVEFSSSLAHLNSRVILNGFSVILRDLYWFQLCFAGNETIFETNSLCFATHTRTILIHVLFDISWNVICDKKKHNHKNADKLRAESLNTFWMFFSANWNGASDKNCERHSKPLEEIDIRRSSCFVRNQLCIREIQVSPISNWMFTSPIIHLCVFIVSQNQ